MPWGAPRTVNGTGETYPCNQAFIKNALTPIPRIHRQRGARRIGSFPARGCDDGVREELAKGTGVCVSVFYFPRRPRAYSRWDALFGAKDTAPSRPGRTFRFLASR